MAERDKSGGVVRRPIVLVGFMGAGKTTIGRALAERLGLAFVDADQMIEAQFGLSIAEIFNRDGEAVFRTAERDLVARLAANDPVVLSVGGGAFVDAETRKLLNQQATTIWLDPPFELIADRLSRSSKRPLALGKSTAEVRRLWEQRRRDYSQAHIRVATSDADIKQAVEQIMEQLA